MPRVILISGKGGVGKTTVAAATAAACAKEGKKTHLISLDSAHSLADALDLPSDLFDKKNGRIQELSPNLSFQEIDVQEELKTYWKDIYSFFSAVLKTSGLSNVVAQELAVFPGMEDVVALLYINQFVRENTYDVLVLDCPPTGESLRFVSLPTTLEWYMEKIFKVERTALKAIRPIAKTLTKLPMPEETYFAAIEKLFDGLNGVEKILLDPKVTSVRLVTSPEKMIVRETQRAFTYFSLYGVMCDLIIINKVINKDNALHNTWYEVQQKHISSLNEHFGQVPLRKVPWYSQEMIGLENLKTIGTELYPNQDASSTLSSEAPFKITEDETQYTLTLKTPNLGQKSIDLNRHQDYLTLRVGNFKRQLLLPRAILNEKILSAKIKKEHLNITFTKGASA
ncbi:ArsA family ATPase [bacterium]|nr:ArsA family ATPase [bacterium]